MTFPQAERFRIPHSELTNCTKQKKHVEHHCTEIVSARKAIKGAISTYSKKVLACLILNCCLLCSLRDALAEPSLKFCDRDRSTITSELRKNGTMPRYVPNKVPRRRMPNNSRPLDVVLFLTGSVKKWRMSCDCG